MTEGSKDRKCSAWEVASNIIAGERMYGVFRLIDIDGVDHSGNREMFGGYTPNREEAVVVAMRLNREEGS